MTDGTPYVEPEEHFHHPFGDDRDKDIETLKLRVAQLERAIENANARILKQPERIAAHGNTARELRAKIDDLSHRLDKMQSDLSMHVMVPLDEYDRLKALDTPVEIAWDPTPEPDAGEDDPWKQVKYVASDFYHDDYDQLRAVRRELFNLGLAVDPADPRLQPLEINDEELGKIVRGVMQDFGVSTPTPWDQLSEARKQPHIVAGRMVALHLNTQRGT